MVASTLAPPVSRRSILRLLAALIAWVTTGANDVGGDATPRRSRAHRNTSTDRRGKHTNRNQHVIDRGNVPRPSPDRLGEPVGSPVALGAYIFNSPGDPTAIDRFAQDVGRPPAIVMWYEQWGGWDQGRLRLPEIREVVSRGATPMITWDPWDPAVGLDQPAYRLDNIVRGHFDAYIDAWATKLAGEELPVLLRFGHEMNGDWYPWCAGCNGNTAADYVAAWRRIHGRFAAAGAVNVRWVWSPNIEFTGSAAMAELYPGDAYVDWVALDGYNWGTSQIGKEWLTFEDIFLPSYQRLLALTSKPMMIAETASTELGGDKATWIRQALLEQLPLTFPRVKAVIWFHENKETDWRISSSPAALTAFQEAASSQYLQGRLA